MLTQTDVYWKRSHQASESLHTEAQSTHINLQSLNNRSLKSGEGVAHQLKRWTALIMLSLPLGAPLPAAQAQTLSHEASQTASVQGRLSLRADAPQQYRVQAGDTLWSIASRFLNDPWLWPQLWQENPQVADPDLIYPGDQLALIYDEQGQPRLQREAPGVVKLSPGVRIASYQQAVPAIPLKKIEPFIERHQVFSPEQIKTSGYVLGAEDGRIVTGIGDLVYVRSAESAADGSRFLVYRQQDTYTRPGKDDEPEVLGVELKYIATLEQESFSGDVAVMRVVQAREEIRADDLVTRRDLGETPATFFPSAPARRVQGEIISVLSGVRFGGTHTVVAINLGKSHRLIPGNVLTIRQQRPPVKDSRSEAMIKLPPEETGRLMVFRTFKEVSYALVMDARKPIRVGDQLITPDS